MKAQQEQYERDIQQLSAIANMKRKFEKEIEFLQDRLAEESEESQQLKEKLTKVKDDMENANKEEIVVSQRSKSSEQVSSQNES